MRQAPCWIVFALLVSPVHAQQTTEERLAQRREISVLLKQLASRSESDRIKALKELGKINHVDARNAIGHKMSADTNKVRIAAAGVMATVKHPFCVTHYKNALNHNSKNDKVTGAIIKGLGKLGMCEGITVLTSLLPGRSKQGETILAALQEIGCPEAVPALQRSYERAQREAKKPDKIKDDRNTRTGSLRTRTDRKGNRDNPNKDKALAKLAPKIAGTIKKLGGKAKRDFGPVVIDRRGWSSIYLCTQTFEEYEIGSRDKWTCPNGRLGGRHKDHFLRHRPGARSRD